MVFDTSIFIDHLRTGHHQQRIANLRVWSETQLWCSRNSAEERPSLPSKSLSKDLLGTIQS